MGKVIVKYQDEDGNEIERSITHSGEVGTMYTTFKLEIKG